jgi:hypothetical protein
VAGAAPEHVADPRQRGPELGLPGGVRRAGPAELRSVTMTSPKSTWNSS